MKETIAKSIKLKAGFGEDEQNWQIITQTHQDKKGEDSNQIKLNKAHI